MTSKPDVMVTDVELLPRKKPPRVLFAEGFLKFDVVEEDPNFAATMHKINGTLATVKKIQNTYSTRISSNGNSRYRAVSFESAD